MFSLFKPKITPEDFGGALYGLFCMAMDAMPQRDELGQGLDRSLVERERAFLISTAIGLAAELGIRDEALRDRASRAFAQQLETAIAGVGGPFFTSAYGPRLKEYQAAWKAVDTAHAVGTTFAHAVGRQNDARLALYGAAMFADVMKNAQDMLRRCRIRG